jgi:hypothetical protein
MPRNVNHVIGKVSREQRKKVETRAAQLIAEEKVLPWGLESDVPMSPERPLRIDITSGLPTTRQLAGRLFADELAM